MNAVNLYVLTRHICDETFPLYEKCLSCRDEELRIRTGELDMIKRIVNTLFQEHINLKCFDDWYYSFSIPQISKEFDLLKIGTNNVVINIEIKEQEVDEERICKQLAQNRYYLSNISREIYSFTCMCTNDGSIRVYELVDGTLESVTFADLKSKVEMIDEAIVSNIESYFRPRDYLISAINTPERFLNNEYFLNNQQEQVKKRIVEGLLINDARMWGIRGGAGTGKTLLLYDIAKTLAEQFQICIIHSGILSRGHMFLNTHLGNVTIIDAKRADENTIKEFDFVCVDETQRLYGATIDDILKLLRENAICGCVFAYDYAQCLSKAERRRNNPERLREIEGFNEERLSERIRTNKEMFSFIRSMLRLSDVSRKPMRYDCVQILYANSEQEADRILDIYMRKEYKFITLTPSQYVPNGIDHYAGYDNSHQVIGQEFDNVVIILDSNFRYNESGDLEGREHPNPDYLFPRLFYQNITRAREMLCIIVLNNPNMFEILLKIKDNSL